jgi:hypothetical protein
MSGRKCGMCDGTGWILCACRNVDPTTCGLCEPSPGVVPCVCPARYRRDDEGRKRVLLVEALYPRRVAR